LIHDSDFAPGGVFDSVNGDIINTLSPDKTGGIPRVHLARSLIHELISEREKSLKFEHPENAELPSATGLAGLPTADGEGEPMESE